MFLDPIQNRVLSARFAHLDAAYLYALLKFLIPQTSILTVVYLTGPFVATSYSNVALAGEIFNMFAIFLSLRDLKHFSLVTYNLGSLT